MEKMKKIAERNIRRLLDLSFKVFPKDRELSKRYVDIALKISMKTRTRIPAEYKRFICRKCRTILIPGVNCRFRLQPRREPHIVRTCLECGRVTRFLLRKSRKN